MAVARDARGTALDRERGEWLREWQRMRDGCIGFDRGVWDQRADR